MKMKGEHMKSMFNTTIKNGLIIIGASGHGRVIADIAIKMGLWRSIAFLDDNNNLESSMNIEIMGTTNDVIEYINNYDIIIAIGNNKIRERFQRQIEAEGANIPVLVHPNAVIGDAVEIQSGSVIMAGTVINSCSSIGRGCIINTGATIDHDNEIGDYCHISPGVHLAGNVVIGNSTWVGIGSVVSNNISITDECIIGAGAVVVKNITETGTYVGSPVRRVK